MNILAMLMRLYVKVLFLSHLSFPIQTCSLEALPLLQWISGTLKMSCQHQQHQCPRYLQDWTWNLNILCQVQGRLSQSLKLHLWHLPYRTQQWLHQTMRQQLQQQAFKPSFDSILELHREPEASFI